MQNYSFTLIEPRTRSSDTGEIFSLDLTRGSPEYLAGCDVMFEMTMSNVGLTIMRIFRMSKESIANVAPTTVTKLDSKIERHVTSSFIR